MSPQFVKSYVKSNKNDAETICEAVTRPSMRFVPIKSIEQIFKRYIVFAQGLCKDEPHWPIKSEVCLANMALSFCRALKKLNNALPLMLADAKNDLIDLPHELFADLYQQFKTVNQQVKK